MMTFLRVSCMALLAFVIGCNHPLPRNPYLEWRLPVAGMNAASNAMPQAAGTQRPLRVVTYNVHRISGAALTRAMLADETVRNADVILLQEVYKHSDCSPACAVAAALGMYSMFAPGHGVPDGTDGVAILSRTPLHDAHVIELPDNFVMFNGGRRVALAVQTTIADTPMLFISVHLENRISVDKRRAQLAPVLAYAQTKALPTVITGDMNTSPFTWAAGVLPFPSAQGCWLEDLARSEGFDTPVADSGPTTPYLSMKLDAIYTRGVRVVNYGVESTMHASDHYPLWADMLIVPTQTAARNSI